LAVGNSRTVAAREARADDAVVLPPFLVEDQRISSLFSRMDWLYFQGGGWEVLSACPMDETERFIRGLREQRAALGQFIADDLVLHTALPTTLILFPKTQKSAMDEQMVKEVERVPSASAAAGHFRPMNDLRLSDPDSSFIFVILDDLQWGWDIRHGYPKGRESAPFYSPPYLRFLIGSRVPALPDWFTTGITRLYESVAFNNTFTGIISSAWTVTLVPPDNPWENSEFQMDPWISGASVAALRQHHKAPRPLLPLRELFVPVIATGGSDLYRRVWEAQAELFVRWALSDRIKDGKTHLKEFVEAAATRPVTEDLFQSCFGMGYADARDALSDFLPLAVSKEQPFDFATMSFDARAVELSEATPQEIHRIKGEWARRTLQVIRSNYPEGLPLFEAKVRRLLQGSYDRGERDPLLLASLALFRLDLGDEKAARQLLEENPAAVDARPLAALELARLRLNEALGKPAGPGGSLSEKQAGQVLQELAKALEKQPPIEAAYLMAARISKHLGRDPTGAERARLNEGARRFPRDSQMVMECISWDLRARDLGSARWLIDLAGYEAADSATRKKLGFLDTLFLTASASGK